MRKQVPLREIAEVGEYRASWAIPSRQGGEITMDGELDLLVDRPPRAYVFGEVPGTYTNADGNRSASFPQSYAAGHVQGRLLNGDHVILADTRVNIMFPDRASLNARAALVGHDAPPSGEWSVARIEVQIEGLDAIAGVRPIKSVTAPFQYPEDKRYLDWSWTATGEPDSTQTWADREAEVELRFYNSFSAADPFAFRVSFSPVVNIRLNRPVSLEDVFEDWIEPFRRIVALATGRRERLTYLALELTGEGGTAEFQVFGHGLHQEPYASDHASARSIRPAFGLAGDDESLLSLIRNWQAMSTSHHPLLETYGALIYAEDGHPRSRLLLLLQAIEGLNGYETREVFAARSETHSIKRQEVIDIASQCLDQSGRKFLRDHLSRRPPESLESALTRVLKDAPVDVTDDLHRSRLLSGYESAVAGLRDVRNALAHGRKGFEGADLQEVVEPLEGVVRAHLLRNLGCSAEAQERAQRRER